MKKFLTIFFVTLGVIFLVIILVVSYLYFSSFSKVKPVIIDTSGKVNDTLSSFIEDEPIENDPPPPVIVEDKNPALNEVQEKTLETFGVDPASLPSELTPEQEACFESVLGADRVSEIKAGDTPSPIEFFKAKECI